MDIAMDPIHEPKGMAMMAGTPQQGWALTRLLHAVSRVVPEHQVPPPPPEHLHGVSGRP
jgi:hypothetical protein